MTERFSEGREAHGIDPELTDPEILDVRTPRGPVRGLSRDGIARFAGIPFAQAPTGPLRFRPPVATSPHQDVLDATSFREVSPQNPSMMDALFGGESEPWDEDCLHLNVWTPTVTPRDPLPVMVWIHGGGFEMGSGSSPLYEGGSFARNGVVYVSFNYRLGSLGFLELGHLDPALSGSGSVGLLDQVEALRWVAENIAAFGGDPDNVTVFGESAGAMSVAALLTLPSARGLFHKAITQSGALQAFADPAHAAMVADEFMGFAGVGSVTELQAVPVTELLGAHAKMSAARIADPESFIKRFGTSLAFLPFRPVADGATVPADPFAEAAEGRAANVPLVVGTNLEEWKLFALMTPPPEDRDALAERIRVLGADAHQVLDAYDRDHPGATVAELQSAVFTDVVFRVPASRLADAHVRHAPVWQYRFDWRSPAMGGLLGAAHAIEIPFVFDMVTDHRLHVMVGPEAPSALAQAMHRAWVSFARDGEPRFDSLQWSPLSDAGRPVLCIDEESEVREDPLAASLRCWPT